MNFSRRKINKPPKLFVFFFFFPFFFVCFFQMHSRRTVVCSLKNIDEFHSNLMQSIYSSKKVVSHVVQRVVARLDQTLRPTFIGSDMPIEQSSQPQIRHEFGFLLHRSRRVVCDEPAVTTGAVRRSNGIIVILLGPRSWKIAVVESSIFPPNA